jgi:hypothetical protein
MKYVHCFLAYCLISMKFGIRDVDVIRLVTSITKPYLFGRKLNHIRAFIVKPSSIKNMDSLSKMCVPTYVTDSNFCIVVRLIFGYACLSRYGS